MAHVSSSKKLHIAEVTAEDLKRHMEAGGDLMVINVLDKKYFDDCHIKGSMSVPLDDLKSQAASWDKNKKIVVYCASYQCSASREAFKLLDEMGFTNIAAYEGGMKEWHEKGYPTQGACQMDYLNS